MEDIKFRVWYSNVKKMVHFENPEVAFDGEKWAIMLCSREGHIYMGANVVMQASGLKDKTGKDIYEGDIVILRRDRGEDEDSFYQRGVVEFSSGAFWINGSGYAENCHFHFNDADREVIGNIYENPGLEKEPE